MNLKKVKTDRSGNHVHLTESDAKILFGSNVEFTATPLQIKGEFATNLKVYDQHDNKYTVMFPFREYSQLEMSMSDYFKIFKKFTKRTNSGENLEFCETLKIKGSEPIYTSIPVVVVKAHIHIVPGTYVGDIDLLNCPFDLTIKENETVDGYAHIHLDNDQYNAIR